MLTIMTYLEFVITPLNYNMLLVLISEIHISPYSFALINFNNTPAKSYGNSIFSLVTLLRKQDELQIKQGESLLLLASVVCPMLSIKSFLTSKVVVNFGGFSIPIYEWRLSNLLL